MSDKVQGRSFTSNHVKLLKHMDKLQLIQDGKPPSPVMCTISLTNACNLTCSFCCFANRKMTETLDTDRVKLALRLLKKIGVKSIEYSGGGSPTLHPDFNEIASYSYDLGFKMGLCTNGTTLGNKVPKEIVQKFTWIRLGLYGFYEGYSYDLSVFEGIDTTLTAAYVWDENIMTSSNPNITGDWTDPKKKRLATKFQTKESFFRMLDWVESNKIPTRIAFNAIKPAEEVKKDIESIRSSIHGLDLKYAFLSDFNFQAERRNDHCYMHMVKPFLFTDGYVYACPSAELSLENNYNYVPESQFMVCKLEDIETYYSQPASVRHHACKFCKYAMQNHLIDDVVLKTEHNEFA